MQEPLSVPTPFLSFFDFCFLFLVFPFSGIFSFSAQKERERSIQRFLNYSCQDKVQGGGSTALNKQTKGCFMKSTLVNEEISCNQ